MVRLVRRRGLVRFALARSREAKILSAMRWSLSLLVLCWVCVVGWVTHAADQLPVAPARPGGPVASQSEPEPSVVFEALCQALRENYPMLEYAGWRDEPWTKEFRTRIAGAGSLNDAYGIMDELVCRLNDYHTRLVWPGKPPLVSPAFRLEPVFATGVAPADHGIWGRTRPPMSLPALDEITIAVVSARTNCGVLVGDEILEVNGLSVREALERAWPHVVGSSVAGKLRAAAGRMVAGTIGEELSLEVRRREPDGFQKTLEIELRRTPPPFEETVSSREVNGVPLIRIARFGNRQGEDLVAQFDELLSRYRNRPGLIIDVRGNGGGEDALAGRLLGRFIAAPIIASISFHRQVPSLTFERTVEWVEPRSWRYSGRVAVLTDEGCMSATEHFVSGMAEAGAVLCGTPTSGACGWIRRVPLPSGATLYVSQTFPLHTGGIPSPLLGIAPNLWAVPTLADLRAGEDTALRDALGWVAGSGLAPVRVQPMPSFSGR